MDDISLGALFLLGLVIYKVASNNNTKPQPPLIISAEQPTQQHIRTSKETTNAQAQEHGWAVTVTQIGPTFYNLDMVYRGNTYTELQVKATACAMLLGSIRDEHPNPIVADKAADLIITLGAYARITN